MANLSIEVPERIDNYRSVRPVESETPYVAAKYASVPQQLREKRQWVCWSYESRPGNPKPTKVPRQPQQELPNASTANPDEWGNFADALKYTPVNGGIGFVFATDDPYLGVDLDNCLDAVTGEVTDDRARQVVELLGPFAYIEISPSGRGLKLFTRGTLPRPEVKAGKFGTKRGPYEIYEAKRFFTVTGNIWRSQTEMRDAPDAVVRQAFAVMFPALDAKPKPPAPTFAANPTGPLTDDEIFRKVNCAGNASKFHALCAGDARAYNGDKSSVDIALAEILAFYTQDPVQLERLMRQYGPWREKWERPDYLPRTIAAALDHVTERYTPRINRVRGSRQESAMTTATTNEEQATMTIQAAEGLTRRLADAILAEDHFARDGGGAVWFYRAGVYVPNGADHIARRVKHFLLAWGADKSWSKKRGQEVCEWIRLDAPQLWDCPPFDTVNLANGLLDLTTNELRPHDPTFLSPVQLPIRYDPDAHCPAWDNFVATTFPEDAQGLAWEIVAWLITPDTSQQKALMLVGEGANGKSVFLAALTTLLGAGNVSAVDLQSLEGNRFAAANLVGKLANIYADLPSTRLTDTSMFKNIVSGDTIQVERKYGAAFTFKPFARLVFATNHLPRSNDATEAFFRRFLVVPFTRTFAEHERVPSHLLNASLADPGELSGVLNKALLALPHLRERGFTESATMHTAREEFRQTTDPFAIWLNHNVIPGAGRYVAKAELHRVYAAACEREGRPPLSPKAVSQSLRRLRHGLLAGQRTIANERKEVWLDIGLREEAQTIGQPDEWTVADAGDAGDAGDYSIVSSFGREGGGEEGEGKEEWGNRLHRLHRLQAVA